MKVRHRKSLRLAEINMDICAYNRLNLQIPNCIFYEKFQTERWLKCNCKFEDILYSFDDGDYEPNYYLYDLFN